MARKKEAIGGKPAADIGETLFDDLRAALERLDRLLERAVSAARAVYGPEAAEDRFRGLHISQDEIDRLLAREPGKPALWQAGDSGDPEIEQGRMAWLARTYGLSSFDADLVLLALAPEVDLRYERLYAYLQDDVTRRRPTVDLGLNLLCPSAEAKLASRRRFAVEAPLLRHGLLELVPDPDQTRPLLAHGMKIDNQVVRFLLHQPGLDTRLAGCCRLTVPMHRPEDSTLDDTIEKGLPALVRHAWTTGRPLRLYFQGPLGTGRHRAAEELASTLGVPLLSADLGRLPEDVDAFERQLKVLFREAWFKNALLFLDGLDELRGAVETPRFRRLVEQIVEDGSIAMLAGEQPWKPPGHHALGVVTVAFPLPDFARRRACWRTDLTAASLTLDDVDLDALADRFRLTSRQIAEAVLTARNHAALRAAARIPVNATRPNTTAPALADLFAGARGQSGHDLAALARKVEPAYTWDDIVVPDDTVAQLREICQRVARRHQVLETWGFDRQLSLGKGSNALFAGPSGTGKTMAAEIIANELELDLYKIDLSSVVSKYIGETEKNLDRVFRAAEDANAVLFFDEADALFGKRSEVRDSHDRYANIEISYLLQKMEEYEGLAILATNLRQNLDESFIRRLAFTVHFPFPDEASRRRIWDGIWPSETPRTADVDLDYLARRFKLSGGNIKNVALASAFLAAGESSPVTMDHLVRATRREYQKMGKTLSDIDLQPPGVPTVMSGASG